MTETAETKPKKTKKPPRTTLLVQPDLPAVAQAGAALELPPGVEQKKATGKPAGKKRVKASKALAPDTSTTLIVPIDPTTAGVPIKSKSDKAEKSDKADKPEKIKAKLVRDSFTMPQDDYALFGKLKDRAILMHHPVKKGELLRAGLHLLQGLDDAALKQALEALPALKPGRPKKSR